MILIFYTVNGYNNLIDGNTEEEIIATNKNSLLAYTIIFVGKGP